MTALSRRRLLQLTGGTAAGGALVAVTPATAAQADTIVPTPLLPTDPEPNVERAKHWWTPQRNVWTPIGWKGHLFRFNVVYNGALICEPGAVLASKPNTAPYNGKNFQLTVSMPRRDGGYNPFPTTSYQVWDDDLGYRKQGWDEGSDTPVLWTDFPRQEGLILRQTVFAHVPGDRAVETAIEPIYAWLRFEVMYVDPLRAPENFVFQLWLSKAYMKPGGSFDQENGVPLNVVPDAAPLTGALTMPRIWNPTGRPITVPVKDAEGKVRLMVRTADKGSIAMTPNARSGVYDLRLGLPATVGSHIDVLVPMLPQPEADVTAVLDRGREAVLAGTQSFWRTQDATAARISTPENYVNQVLRRSPQLAEVVAEKSPDTGLFTFLSGSYAYDVLWSTPTSMICHMFLDRLGYHDVVERHIEIYRATQGARVPPGVAFSGGTYPGYLSTPQVLQAIDWMSDHGAILEVLSMHALLSGRQQFIDRWTDPIVKACDHIVQVCAMTNHNGVKGLVPPGHSTDEGVENQGFNGQCWTYRGLRSAVELLHRIGHPRAAAFDEFSEEFRETFVAAMDDLADRSQKWTDAEGNEWPAFKPYFSGSGAWDDFVMLDGGALMAVWAGLMPATHPYMRSFVEFFRVGPNTKLFDPAHHNALYRAVLDHEQSSSEPCYSWNLFHTWQLGDRARFLEGMYGLLAGGLSQDTYISSEHRHAIYGSLFTQPIIVWSLLHAVIDDSLTRGEIKLLRLCPLEWLSADTETRFDKVPTRYGPVSLRMKLSSDRRTLSVTAEGDWHHRPDRMVLTTPPLPGLRWIVANGMKYRAGEGIVL
jgi:hypothetical protein